MPTLLTPPLHSPVRVAEQRWAGAGEKHARALEHPWQARLECLPYQAVLPRGKRLQPPPPLNKSGLGAAKSPLLSDLPRFKLRSFNQVMLQERSLRIGEPQSGLQLCLTDTKEELPTTKTVAERNNFALKCFCFLS